MGKTYKMDEIFSCSREKLLKLMTDPSIRKAESMEIGGALEAEANVEKGPDGNHHLTVISKVHPRKMDGKKDKSKTERAILRESWNIDKFECDWSYTLEETFSDKVKVTGHKRILDRSDKCQYMDEVNVEVNIPVIGGMIAQTVVSHLEKGTPRLIEWINKKLNEV